MNFAITTLNNFKFLKGNDSPLRINGELMNLTPGLHGIHVHQFGDLTNGCISSGPHLNPYNRTHGGPSDDERHLGDLGNLIADVNGVARFDITDRLLRLDGPHSIIGRTIVVHADPVILNFIY
jgi:Cu-Zn family superoxide dismutase